MQTQLITANNQLTMSSREIAELTGKRHDNVKSDIEKLLKDLNLNAPEFSGTYIATNGNKALEYSLPKRECLILISGYSVTLRAKIVDRWQELENKNKISLPDFSNPAEAARAWAIEYEEKQRALALVEEQKPKVKAFDSLIGSDAVFSMNQTAKLLSWGRNKLFAELRDRGILLADNLPAQNQINAGRFVVKDTVVDRGIKSIIVSQTFVTTKGQVWLNEILKKTCKSELI